jgi:succinate-semialdehyde dehydrogenase/glutarate-semialdehyde dehydrogenase
MADTLASTNPATGEAIDEVPIADEEQVRQAVEAARSAQRDWADRPEPDRLVVLERFQQALLDRRREVADAVAREAGKPVPEALVADVMPALEQVAFLDRHGADTLDGPTHRLDNPMLKDRTSRIRREPLGVVGVIAPWNYPFGIPASQALTALYAGNTVVLKPSEHTPLVAERLVDLLHEAGVADDALHLVQGAGEPTGRALAEANLDALVFTGSVDTGRSVQRAAGPIPTVLEMGGNDPALVLDDANVALAAKGIAWAGFANAGQTCASVERVYAHEAVVDDLVDELAEETRALTVGPGTAHGTDVGPLITPQAGERVEHVIEDAVDEGATLVEGGDGLPELGAAFLKPTLLRDVPEETELLREETFGPVVPVVPVQDEQTAIERANDSRYGLTASVWTTRPDRGQRVAEQIEAGTITINDHAYTYAACETPWGGIKDSGVGHTHGRPGLESLTRLKHVNSARGGRRRSPWYFPYDEDAECLGDEGLELLYGDKLDGLPAIGAFMRRFF